MLRLPKFKYYAPATVAEACKILAGEDAMLVAGGTDLFPKMKRRQIVPKVLVSTCNLKELRRIDGVHIGANVTLRELQESEVILRNYKFIADTAELISTPILQNTGTIGGNLCVDTRCFFYDMPYFWRKSINFCKKKDGDICWVARSSPRCWAVCSSDLAPVMVAIGARIHLQSVRGERVIHAEELYNDDGIQYLNKKPDELITQIELPPANGWRAHYKKLRRRGSFDFPVLGVAVYLKGTEDARIVLTGAYSCPLRIKEAEAEVKGKKLDEELIQKVAQISYIKGKPLQNTDFTLSWRKEMIKKFVADALRELAEQSSSV